MRSRPPKKGECPKRYSKREAIIADRQQLKVLRILADQRANLMEKSNARSEQGASEVREAPGSA